MDRVNSINDYSKTLRGNYKEVKGWIKDALELGLPVLLLGHPGVGKSTMIREIAEEFGMDVVELWLSLVKPTELCGFWLTDEKTGKVRYCMPNWVKTDEKGNPVPFLLFMMDDFNTVISLLHRDPVYQIVFEQRIGPVKFAKGTKIVVAGILLTDNTLAVPISSALINRFVQIILEPDVDCWLEWARKAGVSPEMRAYIKFKGLKALFDLPQDENDQNPFPTPRSITAADHVYQRYKNEFSREELIGLVGGAIGLSAANEFINYVDLYKTVNIKESLKEGRIIGEGVSEEKKREPSFLYAFTYALADYIMKMKPEEVAKTKLLDLLRSFPSEEYVVVFLHEIKENNKVCDVIISMIKNNEKTMSLYSRLIQELMDIKDTQSKGETLRV